MTLSDEQLAEIRKREQAATEGPWWFDESDQCWRLHGVMHRIPAQTVVPEQVVNKQILKAPKRNTPYAEYWPEPADAEFIAHARADVPTLLEEVDRLQRGGKELGKVVDYLATLIREAFRQAADDPIGALHMLGDHLAELLPDEGGLPTDDHNRAYRALDDWRRELAGVEKLRGTLTEVEADRDHHKGVAAAALKGWDSTKKLLEETKVERDVARAGAQVLSARVARVRQMADAWETELPGLISTDAAVDALRSATEVAP